MSDHILGLRKKHEHREQKEMKKNRNHQHLVEIDGLGLRGSHWLGSVIIPIFWTPARRMVAMTLMTKP